MVKGFAQEKLSGKSKRLLQAEESLRDFLWENVFGQYDKLYTQILARSSIL